MSGQKASGPMDNVDFEKQEKDLLLRADAFRKKHSQPGNPLKVTNQVVNIFSDGVRMSGTIWRSDTLKETSKAPAILMCHGWGGKRAHLDFSYAPKFAAAGYIVLTFDYRTWGDSDGMIIPAEPIPSPANKNDSVTMKVKVARKIVDPEWQLRDIDSALNYLLGLSQVDTTKIGIWGSSLGGGHVLATAAKKGNKIKALVCQIGSIDTHANWINRHPDYKGQQAIENLAIKQAQGEVFPWTLKNPIGLDGSPNLPKVVFEHTRNTIEGLEKISCPVLLLAAEKEELFMNEKNSDLVYQKLKGKVPVELGYLPGGHYDAYNNPAYKIGLDRALQWFNGYIGTVSSSL